MYITQSYKYELNKIIYVSRNLPDNANVLEVMNILNAEKRYNLIHKLDKKNVGVSIWLKDGDSEENYIEIEELNEI